MDKMRDFYSFIEEIGFAKVNNDYKKIYTRSNVSLRIDEFENILHITIRDKKGWTILKDSYVELPRNDEGKISMLIGSLMNDNILDLNDLEILMTKHI